MNLKDYFYGFRFGGFNFGVTLNRTDQYTRGLSTGGNQINGHFTGEREVWESIYGNELRLYKTTPEVFIVVDRFASMFSNGIFKVKNYKTEEVIENHPFLKVLEKPNFLMNRNVWLKDIATNYLIFGGSYINHLKGSNLTEFPTRFNNLPNTDLKTVWTGKFWKVKNIEEIIKEYQIISTKETFKPLEVISIRRFNSNDITKNISVLDALTMPLSNIRGSYGFRNVNITKKGALGVMSPDGKDSIGAINLDSDSRLDLEKQFSRETHGIFDKQSPIKFSNTPVKYQSTSYPIKDQMLFEEISEDMMKIIDACQLNTNIFSRKDSPKYENMIEGIKLAYQDGIIPFAELFCYSLNDSLKLFDKGIYLELDYSHLPCFKENELNASRVLQLKTVAYQNLITSGFTPDEAKLITGLSN